MATAALDRPLSIVSEEIKPSIGTRILNTKEELLDGQLGPELKELLQERGILIFPQINFTDQEQIAFTKTMGTFASEVRDGEEEVIHKITLDEKENPQSAAFLRGSLYWHIDGTMNKVPILASLLSCKKPSPKGTGNTGFANTYAAYEALPEERKAEIADLRVNHGAWASLFYYSPEPSMKMLDIMQGIGEQELPLVWTHQSGRKSLVLGNTAINVVGMSPKESQRTLHGLREWATGEEFTHSHEWTAGDLVIWDNTGTMHRAEPYDATCGRMMHRTKLQGEEPFE
ncbi:TauD/TfdA family dioxygenase [Sphingomonas sp. OK281]|uniref:TauD/TfdA dioxygenase family protein n=1 Tax=Sphingomonas sp. OK281 TaxID=1881067 RepID=UPI0008E38631|nr:TauD/TfdA family dioxygenase [Sphingomonas sp. OK281]SFO35833.1 Taurine dioxygenase, alpha-ketoglutarate-dependent [Sphingomonas sp. OK281]